MASYAFHPEASTEYLKATRYYLDRASPLVAAAFVAEIEAAIKSVLALPAAWRVVEEARDPALLPQTISIFALL